MLMPDIDWLNEDNPLQLASCGAKVTDVEICTPYVAAPFEEFQLSRSVVGRFADPFKGADGTGTFGAGGTVVKYQAELQLLVPERFVALALQ